MGKARSLFDFLTLVLSESFCNLFSLQYYLTRQVDYLLLKP